MSNMFKQEVIARQFSPAERIVLFSGDCLELFKQLPDDSIQLVVTSPPYNIGKEYEKRLHLDTYIEQQRAVITE
jgi:DNA modification methylase